MEPRVLTAKEVLSGYDAVSNLYPHIIPMCIWRAWEYAAYRHLSLPEPILDLGCGDGRFFRLAWPKAKRVVGLDSDPGVVYAARHSRVYQMILRAQAHQIPIPPQRFRSVLANCSLEHMDHLLQVFQCVSKILEPEGIFVLSVVNENFHQWATLPFLLDNLGLPDSARAIREGYRRYHHVVNAFPAAKWMELLAESGLEAQEHIAIVPELTTRLFLFWDNLWHIPSSNQEIGDGLVLFLQRLPHFTAGFREILAGVLKMEPDWSTGSGAILLARKKRS